MFFLRCVFWLGVVYASISWPNGAFDTMRPHDQAMAGALTQAAVGRVATYCATHAQECLAGAAHLDALVAATARTGDAARADDLPPAVAANVPLPVPDPRRAARTRY